MTHTNSLWIGKAGQVQDTRQAPPGVFGYNGTTPKPFEDGVFRTGNVNWYSYGAPATLAANNIALAQSISGAGNALINGSLASGGVATLDVNRCVEVASSSAGDTTQTVTITGTDLYGVVHTATVTLNGTSPVITKKAFLTVTQIALSAALAGNLTVGTSDTFGLPYVTTDGGQILPMFNGALITSYTLTAADATAATSLTGDVRGTISSGSITSNGTKILSLFYGQSFTNLDAINTVIGVPEA